MKKITLLLSAMLLACATNLWAADSQTAEFDWTSTTTTETKTQTWSVTEQDITLTFDKGTNQNTPSPNKEGAVRMYTGTTLTISATEGCLITKVDFTQTTNSYPATNLQYQGKNLTSNSWTLETPANPIVLTASNNARFKKIVVTYTPAPTAELTTITLSGEPIKKEYIVEESFDKTGIIATATYSDGSTANVTGIVDWEINPVTFESASPNTSVDVMAYIGGIKSNVLTINNIEVRNLYNYAITWKVNGETYTTGEPTTTVVEGNKITILPTAPANNSLSCTNAFVGWSTTNLGAEAGLEKPDDLFMEAEKAPMPTGDMTFYAVFATETTSENAKLVDFTSGGKSVLAEIEGITTSGLGSDYSADSHAPYIVKFDGTNDYIIWENINSNFVDSVTFGVKMIGGNSKSTMTVLTSEDGTTYTEVQACVISGNQNDILSFNVPIAATPAFIKLNFTKGSNVGFGNFVIYGTGITYADYRTACGTTPSAISSAAVETPAVKSIENGQLVILRDGVKYNAMGVRLQ